MQNSQQPPKDDNKPGYDVYDAFLNWTLDKEIEEYRQYTHHLHNTQLMVIRNYLWLAAMIVGAISAVLATIDFNLATISAHTAIGSSILMFSMLIALDAFISGTRLLLGDAYPVITNSYVDNLKAGFGHDNSGNTIDVKQSLAVDLQHSIDNLRESHTAKALKIRKLNKLIVSSAVITAVGTFFLYVLK